MVSLSSVSYTHLDVYKRQSLDKDLKAEVANGGNKEAAKKVGAALAKKAAAKGIEEVCFDRGGFLYHGRVAELAAGAREGGLKF